MKMCEFVVYMEEKDGTRREVTRDIVVARRREGKTLLMDVIGSVTTVENSAIKEVNTLTQELILVPD
jgi:hypothetical protein